MTDDRKQKRTTDTDYGHGAQMTDTDTDTVTGADTATDAEHHPQRKNCRRNFRLQITDLDFRFGAPPLSRTQSLTCNSQPQRKILDIKSDYRRQIQITDTERR